MNIFGIYEEQKHMELTLSQEKAFNSLIYFAGCIQPLYLTKALKLLYLADEKAVKETGVPITWLTYKAWRLGPVADEVYNHVKNVESMQQLFETEYLILNKIQVAAAPRHLPEGLTLKVIHTFDDSRFSDYEVEVLEAVIKEYGKFTSEQLVDILHQEGSLWHQAVEKHQLQEQFDLKQNRSDYVLEFTKLLDTDFKKAAFEVAYQSYLLESNLL